jgi:hypothetical protein
MTNLNAEYEEKVMQIKDFRPVGTEPGLDVAALPVNGWQP